MRNRRVMGVFDRPDDAQRVKDELLEAGVALHRIVITGSARQGEDWDRRCVLEVVARSPVDRKEIARLMRRHGARETGETFRNP